VMEIGIRTRTYRFLYFLHLIGQLEVLTRMPPQTELLACGEIHTRRNGARSPIERSPELDCKLKQAWAVLPAISLVS